VVLVNSHDGSSSYQIMGGLFRLVCLNGMVVPEGRCETVKVPHKGDVRDKVVEGSFKVLGESAEVLRIAADWRGIELRRDEQAALAEAAHVLRFGDAEGKVETPIQPDQLLRPRRAADAGNDLWRAFNRVQENATKGGVSAYDAKAERWVTTREVKGIDGDVRLNRALMVLAERMAALKGA
jgi:hypothetical protein